MSHLNHIHILLVSDYFFFFIFGPISMGFCERVGLGLRVTGKILVLKNTKGCHGNLKSLLSNQILPEKAALAAISSAVSQPVSTKFGKT